MFLKGESSNMTLDLTCNAGTYINDNISESSNQNLLNFQMKPVVAAQNLIPKPNPVRKLDLTNKS